MREDLKTVFNAMGGAVVSPTVNVVGSNTDDKSSPQVNTAIIATPKIMERGFGALSDLYGKMIVALTDQTGILSSMGITLKGSRGDAKEIALDARRSEQLSADNKADDKGVKPKTQKLKIDPGSSESFFENLFSGMGDMKKLGVRELLTGAMIAPFVYQFAKGFLSNITDGLVELTPQSLFGLSSIMQKGSVHIQKVVNMFTGMLDGVKKVMAVLTRGKFSTT